MATITLTERDVESPQMGDIHIATRLLNGTLHSQWPKHEQFATIDGLLRSHAAQPDEAQHPLICYPVHGAADFEKHTAKDIDHYTEVAVRYYTQQGLAPADPTLDEAPVVAMLVGSSFEVVVTLFALNRLGYAVLFLSTRLTAPAYSRLMDMANCRKIIHTCQFQQIVSEMRTGRLEWSTFTLLSREDWFNQPVSPYRFKREDVNPSREGKKIAWILHSSGSTGFPKPIFLTNLQTLANFRKSFGLRLFTISPLFHSFALMELGRAFYTRAPTYLGNHSLPVTYQTLCDALQVAQPQQISAVPYAIKLLAEGQEGIDALAKAQLVLFGGSSCPDDLGDRLVAQGVNLVANYGATETGQIMTSFRPAEDKEWQYMRLHRPVADFTLMDEISPGVFECVALDGLPSKGPSNSKPPFSAKNPENSFRTADLFTRHPDPAKCNFYKYLSRLDDRITLINGEKVLPIPIEGRIREEPIVSDCVVFGFQRTVPGALIFRAPGKVSHLSDDEFLDAIWPAVEAANARSETFSRIPKELVVIKGADVVYPKTDKGTCIRAQVYQQFEDDIKQTYAKFDGNDQTRGSLALSVPELQDWLLTRFKDDLSVTLPDADADIFSAGVDSLQTMRIWRFIVRDIDIGDQGDQLSQNIVFEKGTVRALAQHLYQLRTGQKSEKEDELHVMRELIEKYSHFTQHFPCTTKRPDTEVVMVTGATGNLGAFIVAELLKRPTVSEVWALIRAPGQAAAGARLYNSLADRNIVLTDTEAAKLHAVPSYLSQPNLGLENHDLQHLLSSLTCVIHSAWAVNFNLGVRSFEQQHIRGTQNLINLCLRSHLPAPARFFFCSSVSAASGTPKPAFIPESIIESLEHAQGTGYGRSKLVTELIVRNAMRQTGMQARVLRIGQLGGDTVSAHWNETEAVALMFRSALATGALPELDERLSWLPVDRCGQAISDIAINEATVSRDADLVYHLVNPRTFSWKEDLLPALKRGSALPGFEVVAPQEWLRRLAGSEQDPEKNPSIKLFDFWQAKYAGLQQAGDSTEEGKDEAGPTFETGLTIQDCPSLALVGDPVAEGLVNRYIEIWMKKWTSK
ncbi:Male sterility NAD-binding [Penicillium bovifimosum]|uniref:Male sterility NAD-binding n=1 Tax=Penicillium bovifimosum TaxID=126998 RepID=A0A9W9KXE7_9EURO|nr:Male sterility NAD-binding [Penicillium bovifimosum]KAJ5124163.1 Male sterility NAD-binding [Penicillium bovifimosum]